MLWWAWKDLGNCLPELGLIRNSSGTQFSRSLPPHSFNRKKSANQVLPGFIDMLLSKPWFRCSCFTISTVSGANVVLVNTWSWCPGGASSACQPQQVLHCLPCVCLSYIAVLTNRIWSSLNVPHVQNKWSKKLFQRLTYPSVCLHIYIHIKCMCVCVCTSAFCRVSSSISPVKTLIICGSFFS